MTSAEKRAINKDKAYIYKKEPMKLSALADKAGGPGVIGLGAGVLSILPSYILMRLLKQRYPLAKALGLSAVVGAGTGISLIPTHPTPGYTFGENLFGKERTSRHENIDRIIDNGEYTKKLSSDGYAFKEAAAFLADLPNTSKLTLHDLVNSTPGFTPPQRDFLHNGIYNAPAKNPNIVDLANGFVSTVNNVTGGLLPTASRAIEGALLGSAFSGVMGVQPGTKKFITGAAAMANSLYGNTLFNTIPQVY